MVLVSVVGVIVGIYLGLLQPDHRGLVLGFCYTLLQTKQWLVNTGRRRAMRRTGAFSLSVACTEIKVVLSVHAAESASYSM